MASRITWFALALAGCGLTAVGSGEPSGADAGTSGVDASLEALPPKADADANADADAAMQDGGPVEGGCTTLVVDDFTSPDPRWVLEKDAVFDGGAATLVLPQQQHHGAIFMPVPVTGTGFTASFTMLMVSGGDAGDPADGITLAWSSDVAQPPIGGTGSQLGYCPDGNSMNIGPAGAALALHVSSPIGISPRESDGGSCIVRAPVAFAFSASQAVSVSVAGTNISGTVGATPFTFQLAAPIPIRWIGFTAATGGGVARFAVDNVTITMCP